MVLYADRVANRSLSGQPDAVLVITAPDMAYMLRENLRGVMCHSDQGSQYANKLFRQPFWRYRMKQSMIYQDNCWDNAPMEGVSVVSKVNECRQRVTGYSLKQKKILAII